MHLSAALEPAHAFERGAADPKPGLSQRGAARRTLRLKALTTTPSVGSAQVIVRDISTAGILIEASSGVLSKDDCLQITLPGNDEVDARVVWQSGRFSGCQFTEPVPVRVVSAALLKGDPARAQEATKLIGAPEQLPAQRRFEPELNFRTATALSLLLWLMIGSAVFAIVW